MLWRQTFKHWDDLRFADSNDADANDFGETLSSDVKQWIQGWNNRWLQ